MIKEQKSIQGVVSNSADQISDLLFARNVGEKYSSSLIDFKIKMCDYDDFILTLKEHYDITVQEYKLSKFSESIYIKENNDNFLITGGVAEDIFIFDIYTANIDTNYFIFKQIQKYIEISNNVEIIFTSAGMNNNGVYYNTKILSKESFKNISTEYYPYININSMFSQFFAYKENILCLGGIPGVGKSKMSTLLMDYMLENERLLDVDSFDYNVLYVKSTDVLVTDEFWSKLDNSAYDLIILDDLDYFLGSRGSITSMEDKEKNKFISNLLSYTDGVQESKTKFVITTNQPIQQIDKAILRKGRMFDILELRPLKLKEAKYIWSTYELDDSLYPDSLKTEEVLQADLGSEIEKMLSNNEDSDDYILEEGISKLKEYSKTKRVGL